MNAYVHVQKYIYNHFPVSDIMCSTDYEFQ